MGNCFSASGAAAAKSAASGDGTLTGPTPPGSHDEKARSRDIDRTLREEERRSAREIKLLLLGAGESGKSTLLRSMRIIHDIPFTPTELEHYRRLVFTNLVQGMKCLLDAMEECGEEFEYPENCSYLGLFLSWPDIAEAEPFPPSYREPLKVLWKDAGVQAIHGRGNEVAVPENLTYFYSDLDRFFEPKYSPSNADILHCRNKTTGIVETTYPIQDRMYRIVDVGGQRSERKKWIHCFEGVTAIMFLVSLSGYDCCLVEDRDSNQMQEALMLFDSICNSKWFLRTAILLFLNKVDLFRDKIARAPIRRHFPDYQGADDDFDAARTYFKERFLRLNRSPAKEIYPSFTNATDTSLLKIVLHSTTDILITQSLRENLF